MTAIILILGSFGVLAVLLFFIKFFVSDKSLNPQQRVMRREKVDPSYTLLSPYIAKKYFNGNGTVYLLDLYGRIVHSWKTQQQVFAAHLRKNGNLVVTSVIADNLDKYPGGGKSGHIAEINWRGDVIREYRNNGIHHDFDVLPSGNIVALCYERAPKDYAKNIQGGIPGSECDGDMWSDAIVEINGIGEVVWRWHAYDHLNPEEFSLSEFTPRSEFMHSNSIKFLPSNPFCEGEAFLISMRHINTVAIIRRSDGEIIWKSPQGMLSYQHDASLLENGNILVFDNGYFRMQKRPFLWSRVVEIDPKCDKIVWEFNGGKSGAEKSRFAASILGGAQRLKNNNTLITDGLRGYIFEVTPDKEIVWDFTNPYTTFSTGPWPNNTIFRARRYRPEEIDWPEKIDDPLPSFPRNLFNW